MLEPRERKVKAYISSVHSSMVMLGMLITTLWIIKTFATSFSRIILAERYFINLLGKIKSPLLVKERDKCLADCHGTSTSSCALVLIDGLDVEETLVITAGFFLCLPIQMFHF